MLVIVVWLGLSSITMGQTLTPELLPGDILITRNAEDKPNNTAGWWNHAAIFVGDNTVIEAQAGPSKVISTNPVDFWVRYPIIKVLRPNDYEVAKQAAQCAKTLQNAKYRRYASAPRNLRPSSRGENCVSVVRRSYLYASGFDYRWRKPDDITNFTTIFIKKP